MQQPTKNFLKDQLALAADEIIRLNGVIDTTKVLMGWNRPAERPPAGNLASYYLQKIAPQKWLKWPR